MSEAGEHMTHTEDIIQALNGGTARTRLEALAQIKRLLDGGEIARPQQEGMTNNHVHTTYSFSPYSPTKAVWKAVEAGLSTVGIMDHDSVSGAEEFITAGQILGIATTVGFEMRTDWSATPLAGRRINNPDQITSAYITAGAIPHTSLAAADAFLAPLRAARNGRNRRMIERLNEITAPLDMAVDFDKDVLPLSMAAEGGSVTERHLLLALVQKLLKRFGAGEALTECITRDLNITLSAKQRALLADPGNGIAAYDLLNVLKGNFVKKIYIDTQKDETPEIEGVVRQIKALGAIPAYCYLGDVGESPTGDKAAQKFEDDCLDEVLETCKALGFTAIAFMPSRNTEAQITRVMKLCREYGFMQISGEDINQPRQSFLCRELLKPEYRHLNEASWALVGHELEATKDISRGMFYGEGSLSAEQIDEMVVRYARIAKEANR